MSDKPLSEMTDEELIAEITAIRERRAKARERRVVTTTGGQKKERGPKAEDVTGVSGLDDLFADDDDLTSE